jgi:hypothetical protein
LTPAAQVHLVNTSLNLLSLEASRFALLQILIESPAFTNAAKEAVLTQIQKLGMESSRLAILKAINERGSLNH